MGLFSRLFGRAITAQEFVLDDGPITTIDGVITALNPRNLRGGMPVDRAAALGVPAVQRGRNLICSISTLPLRQYAPDRKPVRSTFLEQVDPQTPNIVLWSQIVEDLLFDAVAWLRVTSRGWGNFPMTAERVAPHRVREQQPPGGEPLSLLPSGIDPNSAMWIDTKIIPGRDLIRFDSPNPALLKAARRAIRRAIALEDAAALYAENPRPADYFTAKDGDDDPDQEKVEEFLGDWAEAREDYATGYVPGWIDYRSVDSPTPRDLQLVELQRRCTLDIANAIGLDPEELGESTTSRTYQNVTDRRRDKINDVLAVYLGAISDRLSMNDVTRRGYTVRHDLAEYLKADPITRTSYYKAMLDMGAIGIPEIREAEYLPDMPTAPTAPAPAPTGDQPMPQDNTAHTAQRFDSDEPMRVTFEMADFKADAAKRTVTGTLLPFGAVGRNAQGKWRFSPGSVDWNRSAISRVKLNRDHERTALLGAAIDLRESEEGIVSAFKVARGAAGDQALSEAEDMVLDGLSAEVDILDFAPDPEDDTVNLVSRARLTGAALTASPAFDDARLTSVAASRHSGGTTVGTKPEADQATTSAEAEGTPQEFTREQVDAIVSAALARGAESTDTAAEINPRRGSTTLERVREPLAYRFDRRGNFAPGEHVFSTDLLKMSRANDDDGSGTDAGRRVMDLLQAAFAGVVTTDVNELNPTVNVPGMYVDQRDYRYPLWDIVRKGAPPNGVQPFGFPKFSSSSGLVGNHTEGTEPTAGTFVTTSQTITPTPISGKGTLTREVWDMGGNPAVSTLIFNQMVRGYNEGLETATAAFIATLTAATDIAITAGAADDTLANAWDAALAGLQFIRGYDFSAFAVESTLYGKFVAAVDSTGRKLFPIIAPQNANGTAASRFRQLDLSGVTATPSWAVDALATPGSVNSSWLFDPTVVHGWATAPQRLEFPGTKPADGTYSPVAHVDIAVWGYKAFANTDIGGVRQVTYDSVP